jgi:hypothetical protein
VKLIVGFLIYYCPVMDFQGAVARCKLTRALGSLPSHWLDVSLYLVDWHNVSIRSLTALDNGNDIVTSSRLTFVNI